MVRNILGVIAGFIVGGIFVNLFQWVGHQIFPNSREHKSERFGFAGRIYENRTARGVSSGNCCPNIGFVFWWFGDGINRNCKKHNGLDLRRFGVIDGWFKCVFAAASDLVCRRFAAFADSVGVAWLACCGNVCERRLMSKQFS